jgi:hypothetical protein
VRLSAVLDAHYFDGFVEGLCGGFYAPVMGRPSLPPGRYFRLLLIGYFEGLDAECGIAWRATDSLAVRSFLRLALDEARRHGRRDAAGVRTPATPPRSSKPRLPPLNKLKTRKPA